MSNTKTKVAAAFLAIMFVVGCGILQPSGDISVDKQAEIIRTTTQTAVYMGLSEMYEDVEDRVEVAQEIKEVLDRDIIPLLINPDATLNYITFKLITSKLENPQYQVLLQHGLAILNTYMETPQVGDVLTQDQVTLLTALITGASQGLDLVIQGAE